MRTVLSGILAPRPESALPDRSSITIEITPEQKRRIDRLAEQRRLSPEAVVRVALDREVRTSSPDAEDSSEGAEPESFLEATRDLVGSVDGPTERRRSRC